MPLDLFAGIRVRDYQAAKSWYEDLLGGEPSFFPTATEAVWELAEHRYLFIVEDRDSPGGADNLIWVDDLDARVAEIAALYRTRRAGVERCAQSRLPRRRRQ
jgi:catechol 2,3-dioxygenase-like lactoylglutathione lyase family enzyme